MITSSTRFFSFFAVLGNHTAAQCCNAAGAVVHKVKECARDTEFYQKMAQIVMSVFQIRGMANAYSSFLSTCGTACLHDFYHIIQQPRDQLFPINASSFDEEKMYARYIEIRGAETSTDNDKKAFKDGIADYLKDLELRGAAFRTVEAARKDYIAYITRITSEELWVMNGSLYQFWRSDEKKVKDVEFAKYLRKSTLLERILNVNWLVVDVACVACYLKEWQLLDLAKYAARIGQVRGLGWVNTQHFDSWFYASITSGFLIKLTIATKQLWKAESTPKEKTRARWDIVTSVAEAALYAASWAGQVGIIRRDDTRLAWITLAAKSLGVMSILVRPKYEFFEKSAATSAQAKEKVV